MLMVVTEKGVNFLFILLFTHQCSLLTLKLTSPTKPERHGVNVHCLTFEVLERQKKKKKKKKKMGKLE